MNKVRSVFAAVALVLTTTALVAPAANAVQPQGRIVVVPAAAASGPIQAKDIGNNNVVNMAGSPIRFAWHVNSGTAKASIVEKRQCGTSHREQKCWQTNPWTNRTLKFKSLHDSRCVEYGDGPFGIKDGFYTLRANDYTKVISRVAFVTVGSRAMCNGHKIIGKFPGTK